MSRAIVGAFGLVLLMASAPAAACMPPAASFGPGSYRLNAGALEEIDRIAASWRRRPSQRIVLTAGADRVGPASYNMLLSRRRGEAVKGALVRRGIPASVISVQATGETSLTADGVEEGFYRSVWMELVETPGCG